MKSDKQPAQSLDDLPRSGVVISRERWLDLIAKEARLLELYRDTGADRADELADISRLVIENAKLRKDEARLDWLEEHLLSLCELSAPDMSGIRYSGQARNPAKARGEGGSSYIRIQGGTVRAAIDAAREAKP
jgi:hypothetical protein